MDERLKVSGFAEFGSAVPKKSSDASRDDIISLFHSVGVIKFGNYTLKSGIISPIYVDLREIISYPKLLRTAAELVIALIYGCDAVPHDVICGVPYAALPVATLVACERNLPMVMRRREAKGYGTKKMVEGKIVPGARCLIIDDVCTSGQSILETAEDLRSVGLVVEHAVVLLDRESGGAEFLRQNGIELHTAMTITDLCDSLHSTGKIDSPLLERVREFVRNSGSVSSVTNGDGIPVKPDWKTLPFDVRKKHTANLIARGLFEIMSKKHSTLAVAADLDTAKAVLDLADAVGPHICMLKLHTDAISDFSEDFTAKLQEKANKFDFLIMEDRKFADIGNTVSKQLSDGVLKMGSWTDMVTFHALPGPGIVAGLKDGMKKIGRDIGLVLVAEMSSKGTLADKDYANKTVKMLDEVSSDVVGLVCQTNIPDCLGYIRMTPGVSMGGPAGDSLGQQYSSPDEVMKRCADVIIVGRGITSSPDPASAAAEYKKQAFKAYQTRVGLL